LFCHFVTVSFSIDLRCEIGGTKGRFKLVCEKLLNNRF
jgi:hypothetical protein